MSNFTEPFSTPPRLQAATLAGRFMQPQFMSNAPIDFHLAGAPRGEWLISVITNGNILYLVTFKWLLTGTYGLPHTFIALTQYISYLNSLVYHIFERIFFFFLRKILGGGAPLRPLWTHRHWPPLCFIGEMVMAWFPSEVTLSIQAKSSICVSRDQRILFHMVSVIKGPFSNFRQAVPYTGMSETD